MSKSTTIKTRFYDPKDEDKVIQLVSSTFEDLNRDKWKWKYLENPDFDPSLVFVAEKEGQVIGCIHYLSRELKTSLSSKINAALGADFVVHPNFRGKGVGSSLLGFSRSSGALERKEIAVTFGFVNSDRVGFYKHNIESSVRPVSTVMYKKFLNTSALEKKFRKIGNAIKKDERLTVGFRLTGFPSFALRIENGKLTIDQSNSAKTDLIVEGNPFFFEALSEGRKGLRHLLKGLLKGDIKVKGSLTKLFKLYRFFKYLK